jgi:hypothetical protein
MTMAIERYFIRHGGRSLGPFTRDQLKERDLSPGTQVWSEQHFEWIDAANCEELSDVIKQRAAPDRPGRGSWWPFRRRRS